MFIRKNYRDLSDLERQNFVQAVLKVKEEGLVDEFADIHASHFQHGIHRSSHFLPWHREFILRFERALQRHVPTVALPYWNSTVDISATDPLWNDEFLGQFDAAWDLGRRLGGVDLPTVDELDLTQGLGSYNAYWRKLERDIHNPPHNWVGGVMAGVASPGDPIFFLHHGWIDRLWAHWRRAHPGAPFVASAAGLGVDDPLMGWPDRKPADVLDHLALGYEYDAEPAVA